MNVAHVSAHYRPIIGGQEVYIANLMEVCRQAGHTSQVFQPYRGEKTEDTTCLPRIRFLSRFIHGIDRKWFNWMISILQPKELFEADAIICHYAFHARPLERVRKKTIILSHGVEWKINNPTAYDHACEKYAKHCIGRFTHVVNDTHYLRQLGIPVEPATNYFEEVAPNIYFIPNCVDTEHFVPGPGLKEYEGRRIILVPRQMAVERGIHLAIDAFKLIASEQPDLEMCLLGKRHRGAKHYLARLDAMIADSGMAHRIYFRDPVPNREMPAWFNSATISLVPTLEKEGTSLSAIEGMSCGVATVTTNVAGLADLPSVQCDPNPASIAAALQKTLANAEAIGQAQRQQVLSTFNMTNWSQGWLKVIEAVKSHNSLIY